MVQLACFSPFLYFFLLYQLSSPCFAYPICHPEESFALLQFKQIFVINSSNFVAGACVRFQDSYPKSMSWNKSLDCCTWDGVYCNRRTGHVIGLDLSCSHLQGDFNLINLNSSLFQLSHLQKLNLGWNNFSGSRIPREIGWLASLTHLNLSNSNFSGQIPSEISHLSQLVSLDISAWYSTLEFKHGGFESLIGNLSKLEVLSLAYVNILSEVPTNLSASFTYLDLHGTGLRGKLLDYIFNLPKLQTVILEGNPALTGPLPHSIGCLKSLNYLDLSGCSLLGSIPESIGNLTEVRVISLSFNNFSGQFPSTIANLTQITSLDLDFNSLTGPLPNNANGLQKLEEFYISRNLVNGIIPSWLFSLPSLTALYLDSNHFSGAINESKSKSLQAIDLGQNQLHGPIPSWLFSLPSLTTLILSSNHFTGRISEFKSKSLQQIDLSQNRLHGPIPKSISSFANLTYFDVSWNNLSGIVHLDMFSGCSQLGYLRLSHNHFSFVISNNANISFPNLFEVSLSSCGLHEFYNFLRHSEQLDSLDLSNNKIPSQIPMWLTSKWSDSLEYLNLSRNILTGIDQLPWKKLEFLDLQSNLFKGHLPASICDLSMLYILNLSNNNFTGELPQCLGNLSSLYVLNLSNNNFSRGLPQYLGNFSSLTVLDLRRNRFHGMIPPFAQGSQLRNIGLNGNKLEGLVPQSLANCKGFEVFDVGYNNINDTFPWWLQSLPKLQVLVLKFNKFHGSLMTSRTLKTELPFPKLRIFDVSGNQFSGLLPAELLKHFDAMKDANENKVAGNYMGSNVSDFSDAYYKASVNVMIKGVEIELVKILTIFTTIDLSCNKFQGEIPESIGYLHSLRLLNLSHNKLIGEIPSLLGNLSNLELLDLSWNQLQGKIPMELTKLTFLEVLNLSQNHLAGHIPRGKQFETFGNDSYGGNSELCGFPLSKDCESTEPTSSPTLQDENESEFLNGLCWSAVLMSYGCVMVFGLTMGFLVFLFQKPKWIFGILEGATYKLQRQKRRVRHRHVSIVH